MGAWLKRQIRFLLLNCLLVACTAQKQRIVSKTSALQRLEIACESEHGPSCFELGQAYLSRDKVSDRRAKRAFETACDLQFGRGCVALGNLIVNDTQLPFALKPDGRSKVARYYEQGCNLGISDGCHRLGRYLFHNARLPREQSQAMRYLDGVCDGTVTSGCKDGLRARLALGRVPSSLLVSRLSVHCRSSTDATKAGTDFCKRLGWYICQQEKSGAQCEAQSMISAIVDKPACPTEDEAWLVSSIHTSVQVCKQNMPAQLDLKFDALGHLSSSSMNNRADSCVGARLRGMKILPPPRAKGCNLTVRF